MIQVLFITWYQSKHRVCFRRAATGFSFPPLPDFAALLAVAAAAAGPPGPPCLPVAARPPDLGSGAPPGPPRLLPTLPDFMGGAYASSAAIARGRGGEEFLLTLSRSSCRRAAPRSSRPCRAPPAAATEKTRETLGFPRLNRPCLFSYSDFLFKSAEKKKNVDLTATPSSAAC